MSRIDIIGQNGPTGEHYLVERIADKLYFARARKGIDAATLRTFALEIIALVRKHDTGETCKTNTPT